MQKVKTEEQSAYSDICSGKGQDGLKRLVYLFREMPAEDVQCADIMISPVQLFIFGMEQYMGGNFGIIEFERGIGNNRIENFGKYPTDELISSLVLLNEKDVMKYAGYVKLYGLTKSDHRGVQFIASAICMLGMPREYFKEDPLQFCMNTLKMAKSYKDLVIVRQMSLLPIMEYINKQYLKDIEKQKYFFERVVEVLPIYGANVLTGIETEISSLGCMLGKISELEQDRLEIETGIQKLARGIVEEQDKVCQYGQIVILSQLSKRLKRNEVVRDSLEELIKRTDATDAAYIRAKLVLGEYLQKTHEAKQMQELSRNILGWGVLPGVVDINLYNEQARILETIGKYFTKYGWYTEAEEVYGGLTEKYPGSRVGKSASYWAKRIKQSPIDASLEMITVEIDGSRLSGELDKVTAYYQDIAEHTPNADLRAKMEAQQRQPSKKLEYNQQVNEMK